LDAHWAHIVIQIIRPEFINVKQFTQRNQLRSFHPNMLCKSQSDQKRNSGKRERKNISSENNKASGKIVPKAIIPIETLN